MSNINSKLELDLEKLSHDMEHIALYQVRPPGMDYFRNLILSLIKDYDYLPINQGYDGEIDIKINLNKKLTCSAEDKMFHTSYITLVESAGKWMESLEDEYDYFEPQFIIFPNDSSVAIKIAYKKKPIKSEDDT